MTDESNIDDKRDSSGKRLSAERLPGKRLSGKRLLEQAYLLETPIDNRKYYDRLADSYDQEFAQGLGYVLPDAVADTYQSRAKPSDTPIVDIGCGTGLLGKALNSTDLVVDGFDISDAMLAHSRATGIYRDLLNIDVTGSIGDYRNEYGAILSSGTFTHGHLGPDVLVKLLDMAKLDGLFVIAINQTHYESKGFAVTVQKMIDNRSIIELVSKQVNIYSHAEHAHSIDQGLIVSFRKS